MARTKRIDTLLNKLRDQPRYASIEQARIVTRCYQENEDKPRILQRALALKAALHEIEIAIEPEELIVGNRTVGPRWGVVFPESGCNWVDREFETLPTRAQDRFNVREADIESFRREIMPYWRGKSLEDVLRTRNGAEFDALGKVVKINQKDHAQGHICPDCATWLRLGPAGLRRDALEKMHSADDGQRLFYQAVVTVMDGAMAFIRRYAELAQSMADRDDANWETLRIVAANCEAIAARPPKGFHEALQSLWFLFVILQMESNASSFSPGRMDEFLWPFYKEDLDAGRIDESRALELLECLWLKFNEIVYMRNANSARYFAGFPIGFNIAVGGVDAEGRDFVNDLSFLLLQAQKDLGLPQPNLSVRLHEGTGDALLKEAVRVVAKGSGMPQFFNDKAVIPALEALGVKEKDARDYAIVGCVELTTQGNNLGWSDSAMFNLNKVLELTLNGGKCLLTGDQLAPDYGDLTTYDTFEALEDAFRRQIDHFMDRMIAACEVVEQAHQELLPSPFLSSVIRDCMDRGVDVTAGGAHYNFSGIQMIQVANLADSLAAIRMLVYEQKRISREELLSALRANFEGYDGLRAMLLNRAPKYGNDIDAVDALGVKWAEYFKNRLGTFTNYRGGPYHTGMYTVSAHVPMGENVGASPDGRKAREPLADGGMSPVYGRDEAGPTAVLKSVSKLDRTLTSNGGLLNMKFLPAFFDTEAGVDKFALFLRTFVDLEIPHIQFNVVRREDLLKAQQHPEQYRSLTVRVAGYTAYFVELAEKLQNEIIARTSYDDI